MLTFVCKVRTKRAAESFALQKARGIGVAVEMLLTSPAWKSRAESIGFVACPKKILVRAFLNCKIYK